MSLMDASRCRHWRIGSCPSVTIRNMGAWGSIFSDLTYVSNWNRTTTTRRQNTLFGWPRTGRGRIAVPVSIHVPTTVIDQKPVERIDVNVNLKKSSVYGEKHFPRERVRLKHNTTGSLHRPKHRGTPRTKSVRVKPGRDFCGNEKSSFILPSLI